MARLLICLPVCLLLAPGYPTTPRAGRDVPLQSLPTVGPRPTLLHAPACAFPASLSWGELYLVGQSATLPRVAAGLFACPLMQSFPARVPWAALRLVGGQGDHPGRDPIAFLEKCLQHYDRAVRAYSLTMRKRERIGDAEHGLEIVEVHFKDRPHTVFMNWQLNPRKAARALYVEGQNGGKMLVKPSKAWAALARFESRDGVVTRDVDSADARQSGRYPISEFGLKKAMERVVRSWKQAREEGALHAEYLGVHLVPDIGNRPCYVFRRTRYARPEKDGVTELTLYIDTETLLQVGSVLRDAQGELVGEYFFSDIRLNPTFRPDQFERAALLAK
jgi:hypothetical protein